MLRKRNKIIHFIIIILIFISCIYSMFTNNYYKGIFLKRLINEESLVAVDYADRFIHISIDDTIEIFDDITRNNYKSIFENDTLKFLKYLHDTYGAKFSMYCFYSFNGIELKNTTDNFRPEFEENSDWLKFGYHAKNNEIDYMIVDENVALNDYNLVINELKRIVGEKSITTVLRLEKFIISEENVRAINSHEYPIAGLLGADTKDRTDYYLNNEENEILFNEDYYYDTENDVFFYNTDLRIEKIKLKNIDNETNKLISDKNIIVFTHEWMFDTLKNKVATKIKMIKICEFAVENGYIFSFPDKQKV